jgi:hypothetical protein
MRRRPGSAPSSSVYGRARAGATNGSPGGGSATHSSTAAASRTERDTTRSVMSPDMKSPKSGAIETRPREGLRPTRPQALAGMRIEPPPSLAWAIGTMPAATAAAEPPLDPPVERFVSHGLRAGP